MGIQDIQLLINNKMKTLANLTIIVFSLLIISCSSNSNSTSSTINVEGMTCAGCEQTIVVNVKELPGIKEIEASHTEKNVRVTYDSSLVKVSDIEGKITTAGYQVIN